MGTICLKLCKTTHWSRNLFARHMLMQPSTLDISSALACAHMHSLLSIISLESCLRCAGQQQTVTVWKVSFTAAFSNLKSTDQNWGAVQSQSVAVVSYYAQVPNQNVTVVPLNTTGASESIDTTFGKQAVAQEFAKLVNNNPQVLTTKNMDWKVSNWMMACDCVCTSTLLGPGKGDKRLLAKH